MAQIVLVVCLLASPTSCQEERPYTEDLTLTGCIVQGQQFAARWLSEHPKWMLSRWRCEKNIPSERAA